MLEVQSMPHAGGEPHSGIKTRVAAHGEAGMPTAESAGTVPVCVARVQLQHEVELARAWRAVVASATHRISTRCLGRRALC
jgi:hypothetical protein